MHDLIFDTDNCMMNWRTYEPLADRDVWETTVERVDSFVGNADESVTTSFQEFYKLLFVVFSILMSEAGYIFKR